MECCHVDCPAAAEFEVYDNLDVFPDATPVGACTAHVGALLGHRTHVKVDPKREVWQVIPIAA